MQTLAARESLEELIDTVRKAEEEVKALKAENAELKAKAVKATDLSKKLRIFERLAEDPPKRLMVVITDTRLCSLIVAAAVKFHGDALGDPDYSPDEETRKRARRNVRDVVEACCLFGLESGRFADVRALYLTEY